MQELENFSDQRKLNDLIDMIFVSNRNSQNKDLRVLFVVQFSIKLPIVGGFGG
jgi:hypothetical protein